MPLVERDGDQPDSLLFRYLQTWQRWVVGLIALLMLGFAPYAILKGHDGLATSTFVLAGLVVAAVAITGVVPRRITYKDATVEFMVQQRVQHEVQAAVEEVADEVAESTGWDSWASFGQGLVDDGGEERVQPASIEAFSRRLNQIRTFEDDALTWIRDYASRRGLEVAESDRGGERGPDCYLREPSNNLEIAVVFRYTWSNDSVERMMRFLTPRLLFICAQTPTIKELEQLRGERMGIRFAIVKTMTTMLDHAIADLRYDDRQRKVAALPGGGWYVSLPLDEE